MADQVSAEQFAQEIKRKYPQYGKVPDAQLARAMVEKYPQYAKQVKLETSHDTVSAPPKLLSGKGLKSAAYTAIDRALPFLPAAGATVGGLAVGPESGFLASPLGAAEGGVIGEAARAGVNRAVFGEKVTPEDEAKNLIEQGVLGGVSEGGARVVGAVGSKVLRPFAEAGPTVRAAKAGTGVRMTPGEASGNASLKRIEELLTHLPGSAGPMEGFREAQIADAGQMTGKVMNQLSPSRMADEQAGQAVQSALKKHTGDVTAKYDEVKKLLGIDSKTFMTPEQINEAVAKKTQFYKDMGGGTPAVVQKLAEARRAAAAPESAIVKRLQGASPEEIVTMVQRKMTLAQLRQFNKVVPEQARRQVQANVLQKMLSEAADAQSGTLDQRALAVAIKRMGPEKGKLIFGPQYQALTEGSALLNRIAPMATNQTGGLGKMHTMRTLLEIGSVAGTALGLSGHAYAAAAAVGGPMLAMRAISLALTHPETSAMMLKVLRGAAVTGARAIPYGVDAALISPADIHQDQAAQ